MSILHLNIASFPVQVERLLTPKLIDRPVAIAASLNRRAPLLYVSSEAYRSGVRKGMSRQRGLSCDRRLICLPPNPRLYERAQKKLLQVVSHFTPAYESKRLGNVYLDMGGMELLLGKPIEAASKIRSELLREMRLIPTFGVAENKLVSRVAAKVIRPRGLYEVFPGNEAEFLHPLSVELLPGIGRVISKKLLRELGVRQIGDLARIPAFILTGLFGRVGLQLHDMANGLDRSVVEAQDELVRRRYGELVRKEEVFREPTNDDERLLSRLWHLIEILGRRLRDYGQMAERGYLEGVYVDYERTGLKFSLRPPTDSDFVLFESCRTGWRKFVTRRIQLKSLSLTLSVIRTHFEQLDFTKDRKREQLLAALDLLRRRYGDSSVRLNPSCDDFA